MNLKISVIDVVQPALPHFDFYGASVASRRKIEHGKAGIRLTVNDRNVEKP
jgi:hypothetical protein